MLSVLGAFVLICHHPTAAQRAQQLSRECENVNRHLLQKSVAGVQVDKKGNLWMATQYGAVYSNGTQVKYVGIPFTVDYKLLRSLKCLKMADGDDIIFYLDNSPLLKAIDGRLQPLELKKGYSYVVNNQLVHILKNKEWGIDSLPGIFLAEKYVFANDLKAFLFRKRWYSKSTFSGKKAVYHSVSTANYRVELTKDAVCFFERGVKTNTVSTGGLLPGLLFSSDSLLAVKIKRQLWLFDLIKGTYRNINFVGGIIAQHLSSLIPLGRDSYLLGSYFNGLLELKFFQGVLYQNYRDASEIDLPVYGYTRRGGSNYTITSDGITCILKKDRSQVLVLKGKWNTKSILTDEDGIIWTALDGFVVGMNVNHQIQYRIKSPSNEIGVFFRCGNEVYFTAGGGIFRISRTAGKADQLAQLKEVAAVYDVKCKASHIYFLTNNGVFKYDRQYQYEQHFLRGLVVRDAAEIGGVWYFACYGQGLVVPEGDNSFKVCFSDMNRWSQAALSVRYDNKLKVMWLLSNRALFLIPVNQENSGFKEYAMMQCGIDVPAQEFIQGTYPAPSSEEEDMYFASNAGLLTFSKNLYNQIRSVPVMLKTFSSSMLGIIQGVRPVLPAGHGELTIDFFTSFSSYKKADPVWYRIIPLNKSWVALPENGQIKVSSLKAGLYQVFVKSPAGERLLLAFTVNKPWFRQGWFIVLAIIGFCVIVIVITRGFIKRAAKKSLNEQNRLEFVVQSKTRDLLEAVRLMARAEDRLKEEYRKKEHLNGLIIHDMKSPLYYLSQSTLKTLEGMGETNSELRKILQNYASVTHDLYMLSDDFITLLKTDTSSPPDFGEFDLCALLREKATIYRPILALNGNHLILKGCDQSLMLNSNEKMFLAIFRNLIDNANKHTCQGTIQIEVISAADTNTELVVSDTGIGLRRAELLKYARSGDSGEEEWHFQKGKTENIGLNIILEFLNTIGGELSYSYNSPTGSIFRLKLKMSKDYSSAIPQAEAR